MGCPRKKLTQSKTTQRQAVSTAGAGGGAAAAIVLLEQLGISVPPELAVFVVWLLSSVLGPIFSRWWASCGDKG